MCEEGKSFTGRLSISGAVVFIGFWGGFLAADPGDITMVSVDSAGIHGNGNSGFTSISADDRFAAFDSEASNLVAGDTNGFSDVSALCGAFLLESVPDHDDCHGVLYRKNSKTN